MFVALPTYFLHGDVEEFRHLFVEESAAGAVGLDPLAVEDELGDGLFADVFEDLVGGAGDDFDVDLVVGDVVLGEEALGFPAVAAPGSGVDGQLHKDSLREERSGIQREEEKQMPQSTHDRVAELHNLAAHAHQKAATSHQQNDHLSAHESSKQALEYSREAHEHSEKVKEEAEKTK